MVYHPLVQSYPNSSGLPKRSGNTFKVRNFKIGDFKIGDFKTGDFKTGDLGI